MGYEQLAASQRAAAGGGGDSSDEEMPQRRAAGELLACKPRWRIAGSQAACCVHAMLQRLRRSSL